MKVVKVLMIVVIVMLLIVWGLVEIFLGMFV